MPRGRRRASVPGGRSIHHRRWADCQPGHDRDPTGEPCDRRPRPAIRAAAAPRWCAIRPAAVPWSAARPDHRACAPGAARQHQRGAAEATGWRESAATAPRCRRRWRCAARADSDSPGIATSRPSSRSRRGATPAHLNPAFIAGSGGTARSEFRLPAVIAQRLIDTLEALRITGLELEIETAVAIAQGLKRGATRTAQRLCQRRQSRHEAGTAGITLRCEQTLLDSRAHGALPRIPRQSVARECADLFIERALGAVLRQKFEQQPAHVYREKDGGEDRREPPALPAAADRDLGGELAAQQVDECARYQLRREQRQRPGIEQLHLEAGALCAQRFDFARAKLPVLRGGVENQIIGRHLAAERGLVSGTEVVGRNRRRRPDGGRTPQRSCPPGPPRATWPTRRGASVPPARITAGGP